MSAQQNASQARSKHRFIHLLPTLALLLAASAQAGTNEWTSMGLQGGTVYDLAFHPTTPAHRRCDDGTTARWVMPVAKDSSFVGIGRGN